MSEYSWVNIWRIIYFDKDIILFEEYSSYDESDEYKSRGNKTQSQNTVQNCRDTRKYAFQGIEMVYFDH